MSDSNKSGKGITIVIVILIFVLLFSPMVIFYGITSTVQNFIKGIAGTAINAATNIIEDIKIFFGASIIKNGMYIYPVEGESVTQLKQQLEAQGIRTDVAGITEVMLRKMILAQAVTSFTKDTLCVAQVSEDEILQGTGYTDLNEYLKTLDKKNSKNKWPIKDYNYDLYYVTDKFFYFKDEDDMMGQGTDKYYLGLIGSVEIKTSEGNELEYVSQDQFAKAQDDFEDLDDKDKNNDKNKVRKDLLHKYTIDSNGEMVVHKIVKNTNKHKYAFTNNNSNTKIQEEGEANSTYQILTVPLDIQGSVDASKYTLSIELLIDLLNISSSPEFIDEFIDYALEESKITITAYLVEDEEISYEKNTYRIKDPFIYELYDMNDETSMNIYKPLIYERKYNGSYFTGSVVDISGFSNIRYMDDNDRVLNEMLTKAEALANCGRNNTEFSYNFLLNACGIEMKTKEEFEGLSDYEKSLYSNNIYTAVRDWVDTNYSSISEETKKDFISFILEGKQYEYTKKIEDCLLAAYEKKTFTLGDVLGEEITINERAETSWRFYVSSLSTWYGNITYDNPTINTVYYIDPAQTTQSEYDSFNENSLTQYTLISEEESKTNIYISNKRATEAGITTSGDPNVVICDTEDIFDDTLKKDIREKCRN